MLARFAHIVGGTLCGFAFGSLVSYSVKPIVPPVTVFGKW